jgi:SAM-dependent methyltransferase
LKLFFRIENIFLDLIYSGSFISGKVISRYRDLGAYNCENTEYNTLRYLFNLVDIKPADIIVDVGCGRGRVIGFLSKRYPHNKIIGIEIDPLIAEVTKKLFEKNSNIEIRVGDINQIFPAEGNFFYLFNPFNMNMMERFVDNLRLSSKSDLILLYCNAKFVRAFDLHDWNINVISPPKWQRYISDHPFAVKVRKK